MPHGAGFEAAVSRGVQKRTMQTFVTGRPGSKNISIL